MSGVHADPEELRDFATHIGRFGTTVGDEIKGLRTHFDGLDWRDAQQARFATEVEEVTGRFRDFLVTANEIATKLLGKAGPLDEYLRGF
ncbi:WXG100 family type VII secretion target [Frankia canadensis]|nr:WXG100 family type VII secretion target [Frankia canadensis]